MSREQLTVPIPEDKMGYDNPGLVTYRKVSTVKNPQAIEEKVAVNDSSPRKSISGDKEVYVVPIGDKFDGPEKNYEPYDHRDVKHPTTSSPSRETPSANIFVLSDKDSISEEYNPYEFREVKHPTTYSETLIHMLKASLGTGILAMPNAFKNAGYIVATVGTLVIGFLCTYTIHILINAEYELCKRKKVPSMTYPATAEAAVSEGPKRLRRFAFIVPIICNVFLLLYQIGSCCIYVVFVATNLKEVVDYYCTEMDVRMYMLCLLLPLILINWVRNLKYLAPLSTIANGATFVSFVIIFYYMFTGEEKTDEWHAVGSLKGMPLFFGTVLFAMEAIGVVMPLENEMKNPRRFGSAFGVLNCAMLPITLLYTFVGFFGYLKYGNDVKGSITLDLKKDEILAQSVKVMLAFAIYITHALACYVAVDITWREYLGPRVNSYKIVWEYALRTVLVFITFALAVAIPNLELFISLIGALCLSTMGLSFPALIQLFTFWYDVPGARFTLFFLKNSIIIFISLLGFIIGTATSIEEIIEKLF